MNSTSPQMTLQQRLLSKTIRRFIGFAGQGPRTPSPNDIPPSKSPIVEMAPFSEATASTIQNHLHSCVHSSRMVKIHLESLREGS